MDNSENAAGPQLSDQIKTEYNIVRLLGEGGMGEVYLAEQLRVGRRLVALKVLNRACSENPELKRRFENEASSAGRIRHRNVVTVYESRGTEDGQLYVAMEYIEGVDLGRTIEARGPLPVSEIVEIVKQTAAGLNAAHKLGIVHRDIKPGNIMLTRDDDGALLVKVLDFGIARLSEADSGSSQTKTGVVMGTPHYMSPEQALGRTGDKIDHRSDVYSLAMVVYQMLTGRVAFESDSWIQVMYKHVNDPPDPPSTVRPQLADILLIDRIIAKGLEKDREKRYQSAVEFADELRAACPSVAAGSKQEGATAIYPVSSIPEGLPFSETPSGVSPAPPSAAQPATPDGPTVLTSPPRPPATAAVAEPPATTASPAAPRPETARPASVAVSQAQTVQPASNNGKKFAMAASAVILVGLVAAAFVVLRGRGAPPQLVASDSSLGTASSSPISSNAGAPSATAQPSASLAAGSAPSPVGVAAGAANRNSASERKEEGQQESKKDAKKETPTPPAANPIDEPASKAARNPHDVATAQAQQPKTVPTPAAPAQPPPAIQPDTQAVTCLGVLVQGAQGNGIGHSHVTVTDGSTRTIEGFTGPEGRHRFCDLGVGHHVTVTVVGPRGKRSSTKEVTLTRGQNFVTFQLQRDEDN